PALPPGSSPSRVTLGVMLRCHGGDSPRPPIVFAQREPKGAGMQGINNSLVARRNPILMGYAAFNDGDWDTLRTLLSPEVVWHPMEGTDDPGDKVGPDAVIAHLQHLRETSEAEFLSMTTKDDVVITLDFTYTTSPPGDHGCADRIRFDESGRIAEVWHCNAATHDHGAGG
ncbi:MAG: nuclear transport factor 2 family protein, partial [Actinobacteria bacterium]|nr:nuclear transport factor 2 family protein [Actinomycetota bacterium]